MHLVGLMSGTSLDGIDACLAEVHGIGDRVRARTLAFRTYPLPDGLRERLLVLMTPETSRLDALASLDVELGELFAACVRRLCAEADFPLERLDAIGSHGQTLWHAPAGPHPATWQLGCPAVIAARTGVTTVANFRPTDVALGGQGAPLVPYVDAVLFGHMGRPVALQNLGGIGNVTYVPGPEQPEGLRAFDTGPGNMAIDALVVRHTGGAQTFDRDGRLAAKGRVDEAFLAERLAADAFLAEAPPKSTGRERYGAAWVEAFWADGSARGLTPEDLIATATAYTAACVADQYRRFLPAEAFPAVVYVSGGGARNPVLMAELRARLGETRVASLAETGLDPDAKEALAFAILAHQTLAGVPNSRPEATGATRAAVLGQIVPGRNFARAVLAPQPLAPGVATEASHPASRDLDALPPEAAVALMHQADYEAVRALGPAQADIARAVVAIADALAAGGRLFYVGAGTSGRLGVLDASECPPTFSAPPEWVQGLIAGGERALTMAVEGAEDDAAAGAADLAARGCGASDVVVGLSANGGAPYVQGALGFARAQGATTVTVSCNPLRPEWHQPDIAIVLPTGPEVLAGSTRLKAGTATKLVLNMLTTLAMARLGKVHDHLMVDVRVSNRKLQARAERLVGRLTGLAAPEAAALLERAGGQVKRAAVMHAQGLGPAEADARLEASRGFLRPWLPSSAAPGEK